MRNKLGIVVSTIVVIVAGMALAAQFTHWRDTVLWDRGDGTCALACSEYAGIGHLVNYLEGDGVRGLTPGDKIISVSNFPLSPHPLPGTDGPRPVRGSIPSRR